LKTDDVTGKKSWVCIGTIVGAFGVRGGVKVRPYTQSDDLFASGESVLISQAGTEDRTLRIVSSQAYKNIIRLWMEGVCDRDQAEALRGFEIYIPRSRLPETEPGTWYWHDLIGLEVYTIDGARIGRVDAMIETGANDVIVIRDTGSEILLPAIAKVVRDIDIDAGIMYVEVPEGL